MALEQGDAEMRTIQQKCLELPLSERKELLVKLKESIDNDLRSDIDFRFALCKTTIEGIIGEPLNATREHLQVVARTCICNQLLSEGFGVAEIGRKMGRHHATTIKAREYLAEWQHLGFAYKEELTIWRNFQKRMTI